MPKSQSAVDLTTQKLASGQQIFLKAYKYSSENINIPG